MIMVQSQFITMRCFKHTISTIVLSIVLSICNNAYAKINTNEKNHVINKNYNFIHQISQDEFKQLVQNIDIQSRIMKQYSNWKGARYHLGGATKYGIDCSAFVQRTFLEQFGIKIPRSTLEQQNSGKYISRNELRPGDLILFHTAGTVSHHIGIYLGNDNFIHASTSNGVMISNLKNHYWKSRYYKACRILAKNFN